MNAPHTEFPHRIEARPDFSLLTVALQVGQTLKVEASSMAGMSTNLRLKTRMRGGFKRFLTRESIFINEFSAEDGPGEIMIAPGAPGDLTHCFMEENQALFLKSSAFLACAPEIQIDTQWQGLFRGMFSGHGLFLAKAHGRGDLWFNSYGAMFKVEVDGQFVVDTGHLLAFSDELEYTVETLGGYKALFFSGEGMICRFSGKGSVWVQTRTVRALAAWTYAFRPQGSSSAVGE
jgi:uncharacterized protein (TIGR00266 family)